jgi:SAM-dependent methyltransferase
MTVSTPATPAVSLPCPHPDWTPLYGRLLRRCESCGVVATGERPSVAYEEGYFTRADDGGYDFGSEFSRAFDAARFVPEIERLEAQGLRGTLLDVGCATGTFLAHAQEGGWTVSGVEVSDFAREQAKARLRAPVVSSLAELPASARYDVVTLHHVLEHVQDPAAFLRDEIWPRVGRRLLIEVPNFASLASSVQGTRWRDLRPDQHIYHFTPETLPRLVSHAGLRPLRVYTLWEPLWTLRTALDTLALLPGLVHRPSHDGSAAAEPQAGAKEGAGYKEPAGPRRWAALLSRQALRPLVRRLEEAGLGGRLVLEAEPDPPLA